MRNCRTQQQNEKKLNNLIEASTNGLGNIDKYRFIFDSDEVLCECQKLYVFYNVFNFLIDQYVKIRMGEKTTERYVKLDFYDIFIYVCVRYETLTENKLPLPSVIELAEKTVLNLVKRDKIEIIIE